MPAARILVCGDREWSDILAVKRELIEIPIDFPDHRIVIVHGDARGADTCGKFVAESLGYEVESHPAQWNLYGRAAGPIRNEEMLQSGLDFAYAFHHDLSKSRGTKDMVTRLENAGIPYKLVNE